MEKIANIVEIKNVESIQLALGPAAGHFATLCV